MRKEILSDLNTLLFPDKYRDYAPNGLQVEGNKTISHIVSGVTANQKLIDAAVLKGADTILVHHGFFWKGEDSCILGIKRKRIESLLKNNINLIAYHLPLDVHPIYGNNKQLADILSLEVDADFGVIDSQSIGLMGRIKVPCKAQEFASKIETALNRKPLYIAPSDKKIHKVAWCTGAAGGLLQQAIDIEADAYITGEVAENTIHLARESGVGLFICGHHATERYGIKALGEYLHAKFGVSHTHVDIDSPL